MAQTVEFDTVVTRWIRIRRETDSDDLPFDLDADGFLAEPTSIAAAVAASNLIRPEEASTQGALVLLGEPGAGKTTTFEQLAGSGPDTPAPEPGQPGTLWVKGSELSDLSAFNSIIGEHLKALPAPPAAASSQAELVVVLDQLDESPYIHHLPDTMRRALVGKDTRSLRMLIACRTADYPARLTSVLRNAERACTIADLAPLTRDDAATLVASLDMDAPAFLDAVTSNDLGVLASVPLTLKVLAAAYQAGAGALQENPRAIFERGVTWLADEPDRDRLQVNPPTTTVGQRMAIAGRIAARLLLSGRRTIWAAESMLVGDDDVTLGSLAGGRESSDSGIFDVTRVAVDETLKTALFSRASHDRVAFAHSSLAAFLAARYLAPRLRDAGLAARRQLAGVFLVAAPDEDTASIPVHLREAAAWLLAHVPAEAEWIASADPEGLMAHSAYITASRNREVLVDGLLARAARIELTERSWQPTRWRLMHPTLAEQVRPVLEHAVAHPSAQWAELAKVRLAVQLARDCALATVANPLLSLAESPGWPGALRQRAMSTAMEAAPEDAAPRLRELLRQLSASPSPDNDQDELIGTLLSILWPDNLTLSEVLPHIRPFRAGILGMYRWQVTQIVKTVEEDDLLELLTFVQQKIDQVSDPQRASQMNDDNEHERTTFASLDEFLEATGMLSTDIVDAVIDRAMRSVNVRDYLPSLATVIAARLQAESEPLMPMAVDLIDDMGVEAAASRDLRHDLVEALIQHIIESNGDFERRDAFLITRHWQAPPLMFGGYDEQATAGYRLARRSQLLDDTDITWSFARADHYREQRHEELAAAFDLIASAIADLGNRATFELVYERREMPGWEHFKWFFQGFPVDDDFAKRARQADRRNNKWEGIDDLIKAQRVRLDSATNGDATAFWKLVRFLSVDPETGNSTFSQSDDLRTFAGTTLWADNELHPQLATAAFRYLSTEHDYRYSWLGTNTIDYRANAGYLALTLLHYTQHPQELPPDRWMSWVGTVVEHARHVIHAGAPSLAMNLLTQVARYAPTDLAVAVQQLVRTNLAHGEAVYGLDTLTTLRSNSLITALVQLARETQAALLAHTQDDNADLPDPKLIVADAQWSLPGTAQGRDAAVSAWASLLYGPLLVGDATAEDIAHAALARSEANDINRRLAVAAGRTLLFADPVGAWPRIYDQIQASTDFARDLAITCASDDRTVIVTETVTEQILAEVYLWLANACPPNTEIYTIGGFALPAHHEVHDWRHKVLSALADRSTQQSIRSLRGLAQQFPDELGIQAALIAARRRAQAANAAGIEPDQVVKLLSSERRRVIRTAGQLAELVAETIAEIETDLDGHANLLWDCERASRPANAAPKTRRPLKWRPKPEGALAAYLAHELTLRLELHNVVVNREVVVRPTDAGDSGERPDIVIDAVVPESHDTTTDAEKFSVPVEVKGAWHKHVLTAQKDQLAERYLPDMNTDSGVYVVGVYPVALWDADDSTRKSRARAVGPADELQLRLLDQARDIRAERENRHTLPCTLTITRAHSTAETGKPRTSRSSASTR
jgi:hypothetical protein